MKGKETCDVVDFYCDVLLYLLKTTYYAQKMKGQWSDGELNLFDG